ncbi:MAG: uncharacterized membrane protein YccF (DUF307 family) [Crocinitomix sp.]|jgi:uncharacterized membrane protein YccF (DUF307 family)
MLCPTGFWPKHISLRKVEIANMVWFIFGGLIIALEYVIASILILFTVVGVSFAKETLKIGSLNSSPFGKRVYQKHNFGQPSLFLNIIWILFGGIWIALSHLILGTAFAITIIGIPFAQKHYRMAAIALIPYGVEILDD